MSVKQTGGEQEGGGGGGEVEDEDEDAGSWVRADCLSFVLDRCELMRVPSYLCEPANSRFPT